MTNQHAQFSSAESRLSISIHRGKQDWVLTVRHKAPNEKAKVGCKEYFAFTAEADAQKTYDRRIKEAVANGWTQEERTTRRKAQAFMEIPMAPSKTAPAAQSPAVATVPRVAKR